MADNITALANTGTGTDVLATDEIGGVHFPRTKLVIGGDGVNGGDVSDANPMPVGDASAAAVLAAVTDLLQEIAIRLADIGDSVANIMPDVAGRIRVAAETGNLTTVTNLTNIGGQTASLHMQFLSQIAEGQLNANIVRI